MSLSERVEDVLDVPLCTGEHEGDYQGDHVCGHCLKGRVLDALHDVVRACYTAASLTPPPFMMIAPESQQREAIAEANGCIKAANAIRSLFPTAFEEPTDGLPPE